MDVLIFYSKSADVKPGKGKGSGWSEKADPQNYKELDGITDWRKMFSNMYICPFKLGGYTWNTVEHFYHAIKYKGKYDDYYKTFTIESKSPWSLNPFDAKNAGKTGRVSEKTGNVYTNSKLGVPTNVKMRPDFYDGIGWRAMKLALMAKFTQCEELTRALLATGNTQLYHLVTERGKKSHLQRWDHLEEIRDCIRKYNGVNMADVLSDTDDEYINKIFLT